MISYTFEKLAGFVPTLSLLICVFSIPFYLLLSMPLSLYYGIRYFKVATASCLSLIGFHLLIWFFYKEIFIMAFFIVTFDGELSI